MTRKPRIAFLINSLVGGGAERVMCTLLEHSAREGEDYDISLTLLDRVDEKYSPPGWVRVRRNDCGERLPASLGAVCCMMREEKPDVTVSFLERSNYCNVLLSRARGKPCIISERVSTKAHFEPGLRSVAAKMLVRTLYPRATKVIAVSQGIADELRDEFAVPAEKLVAIANPLDLDAVRARARLAPSFEVGAPFVLSAGRLVPNKNFALLVRAFAASALPDKLGAKLVILGDGPEREALLSLAQERGIGERLVLPGFERNPHALMARALVFALPSNAEGFPNSLVEAMASGAPVISTNCATGPSEILAETAIENVCELSFAAHGVLTPPNDVEAMTKALDAMLDEHVRADYARRALARAEAYGAGIAKDAYWNVIRQALPAGLRV